MQSDKNFSHFSNCLRTDIYRTFDLQTTDFKYKEVRMRFKILVFIFLLTFISCSIENEREKYAQLIIEKVEKFKSDKNRLPENVSEIGLVELENSEAFYEKKTDSTYIVWFGLSLGESKTYNSSTKEWK